MGQKNQKHSHHIMPTSVALAIGGSLILLTGVTVWVAQIDLGQFNFLIAMVVATIKALLVALFFMGLIYDHRENGVIFATSFVFLAIFMILVSADLFFRPHVVVKESLLSTSGLQSKLKNPWVSTPELVAKGKTLFAVQCATCHGAEGKGNGPAASALNPKPRNFTENEGWKNGRKPTMVFKTLKEGLAPSAMASYASLPADDRWALSHYVLALGPQPAPEDTAADFAKVGIDPNGPSVEEKVDPTLPLWVAMERSAVTAPEESQARLFHPQQAKAVDHQPGVMLYQAYCLRCHGDRGQGHIRVQNLGLNPVAFVATTSFRTQSAGLKSQERFNQLVVQGLPGSLMPGMGQLSRSQLRDLYLYVMTLVSN